MSSNRSCLECRRRKIRCDRESPCAYCVKTGNQCIYPDTESEERTSRRIGPPTSDSVKSARIQTLENRVQQLETRLSEVENRIGAGSNPFTFSQRSPSGLAEPHLGMRLPEGYPPSQKDIIDNYLTDIDPLFKLVDHQFVEDSLLVYPHTSTEGKALMLAISFAVQTSKPDISAEDYASVSTAVELSLQTANLDSSPTLVTLQALTIFLTFGRLKMAESDLRANLTRLIGLAMKQGLHQDPDSSGYLPKDIELRRRLWWAIKALDIRTAESYGTSDIIQSKHTDTETAPPSMVRDLDLRSTTFFTPSIHAPCMYFYVVAVDMARIAKRVLFTVNPSLLNPDRIILSNRLHSEVIEKVAEKCQCKDSPICRLTKAWIQIYWDRLNLLILHWDKIFLRRVAEQGDSTEGDGDFKTCVDILERVRSLREDNLFSRWDWLWQNVVEWDVIGILLSLIANRVSTHQLVGRAWAAIDDSLATWKSYNVMDPFHLKRFSQLITFRDWVHATKREIPMQ